MCARWPRGKPFSGPVYDFKTHTRVAGVSETVAPTALWIVKGFLAPALRGSAALLRVFHLCEMRRTRCACTADSPRHEGAGRTEESVPRAVCRDRAAHADLYVGAFGARASFTVEAPMRWIGRGADIEAGSTRMG